MELNELKRTIQEFFQENTVTIVGSDLSAAENIPGMKDLAKRLLLSFATRHLYLPIKEDADGVQKQALYNFEPLAVKGQHGNIVCGFHAAIAAHRILTAVTLKRD